MAATTMTLSEMRTELIYEAGIDGATGSNDRHVTARLNSIINRYWGSSLVLLNVSDENWNRAETTSAAISAAVSGEEYIDLTFPSSAVEISGVDVQIGGEWHKLDEAEWAQRRLLPDAPAPSGTGWWAIHTLPSSTQSTSVTDGKVSIWPSTLSGNYKIYYTTNFTAITDDNHKFVGLPDQFTWVIASAAMVISRRDENKSEIFAFHKLTKDEAERRLKMQAGRMGPGKVTPQLTGGDIFA